jgi:hypothetical protein
VREAPPHERLLTLAGCTLTEFATRIAPEVSRSRLRAVLEQAESRGRMTRAWAERLGQVVGASAEEVLTLFAIEQPASRGRPRRRSALATATTTATATATATRRSA